MHPDLELAFQLADAADQVTLRWWSPNGVDSTTKIDGSPVTEADLAAEHAMLDVVRDAHPDDGFLGEEVGERPGTTGRRWIVDGIDGTRHFAAGLPEWGTLIALERDGAIVPGRVIQPGPGPAVVGVSRAWGVHWTVDHTFGRHPDPGLDTPRLERGPLRDPSSP